MDPVFGSSASHAMYEQMNISSDESIDIVDVLDVESVKNIREAIKNVKGIHADSPDNGQYTIGVDNEQVIAKTVEALSTLQGFRKADNGNYYYNDHLVVIETSDVARAW